MPARINRLTHSKKDKDRIRASQLCNRLDSFVRGEIVLSPAQVQAAKILIGKVVPDLKSVELTGAEDKPLLSAVTVTFVQPDIAKIL